MFTEGLDPSALEWVQRDLKKTPGAASNVFSEPANMISPGLARETVLPGRLTAKSWGLPPTQLHNSQFHSGLLRPTYPPSSPDDLDESIGSVSLDGHTVDTSDSDEQESNPYSGDLSPKPTIYGGDPEDIISGTKDEVHLKSYGLHPEYQAVDESYYDYDRRLLSSKTNSKSNSGCNSQRESFRQHDHAWAKTGSASVHSYEGPERIDRMTSYQQHEDWIRRTPIYDKENRSDRESLEDEGSIDEQFGEMEEDLTRKNLLSQMANLRFNQDLSAHGSVPTRARSNGVHARSPMKNYPASEDQHPGISENIGASPSAPPMVSPASFEAKAESVSGPLISQSVGQAYDSSKQRGNPDRLQESSTLEVEQGTETCFSSEPVRNPNVMEGDEVDSTVRQTATTTDLQPPVHLSGHAAWQALIAYDACVRLCLRAWAKGCMEAPEFLLNECSLLRNSFGLQHLLLQPHDDAVLSSKDSDGADVASVSKPKGNAGRIKVQVRKIRTFPRQGLQGSFSQRSSAYVQVGAQYVRQVSGLVKSGVKNILSTTLDTQEIYSCVLWLKSTASEEGVLSHPGSGDMHVFHPESPVDNLLLEVQDSKGNAQGRGVVQLSSLTDDPNDHVRWWPIFNDQDHECVGKVQLFITYSANLSEDGSKKWGPVGETLAYDIVLEVAMRAQLFQRRNLRLHGPWKWLLSEFAIFYGVSNVYTSLRYLACIMEVSTPTEDCLVLIHDLLSPIVKAQVETTFTRQEKRMLSEVEDHVEQLIASVFENYKSLDEMSPSGLSETLTQLNGKAAPALVPAVKIFTLLHDILSVEAQKTLCNYFQRAAKKRCRRHMADSDEFVTGSNEGFLMDPMTITTAYAKLKALCVNMCNEVQMDIELHNQHILPSSIDLPNITADVYCSELSLRLKSFLVACPPSGPSPPVVELLIATADFQQDLISWKISPLKGGKVDAKDLFHLYIVLWIQERRLSLLDFCKLDKVRWTGATTSNGTSPFVEEMYARIKDTLNEYDTLLNHWPEYTLHLETAIADVETAVVAALEKQYADALAPLKDVMVTKKFTLQYMQKLTRRRSIALYSVPNQLGTFLNTIKRLLDILRPKIDVQMKSWVACIPIESNSKVSFGERLNEVTILLRAKYKNFIQAIVEKLVDNARLHSTTKLKRILQDTREAGGESEIRDRMQPLSIQLLDTITHLHDVFTPRVFVAICRGYWDRMGQDVLHFLENRKENRLWYKGSHFALLILDDIFASQMQKLQGHALQEKDVDPPRSVMEARSMLSRDAHNCVDSSNYLYF